MRDEPQDHAALVALRKALAAMVTSWRQSARHYEETAPMATPPQANVAVAAALRNRADQLEAVLSALPSGGAEPKPVKW